jgi:spermidine synthase
VFVVLYVWTTRAGLGRALALSGGVVVAAYLVPSADVFWSRLHASSPDRTIAREDASGVVLLRDTSDGESTHVFMSGISQSWLPYGSIHTALGALPAFVHPHPVRVAVIGLGSGDTAFAIGGRPETERIDSIEIVRPQLDALTTLNGQARYPALGRLLADPRLVHHFADGRALLRRRDARYDIIEADALLPRHAYAGHLYSVEYFRLLGERLTPGGFAVTWTPTERTRASLLAVFPHVLMFRTIAIGSHAPIAFDRPAIESRLRDDFSRRYYAGGQVDVEAALRPFLADEPVYYGPGFDRRALTDVNRDLFPQDEFGRAYRGPSESLVAPMLTR